MGLPFLQNPGIEWTLFRGKTGSAEVSIPEQCVEFTRVCQMRGQQAGFCY